MTRVAAPLLALATPCLLAMSTPVGSLRSAPVITQHASEAECLAALNRWAEEQREEQRKSPIVEPDQWHLSGDSSNGRSWYALTRVNVSQIDGLRTAIGYVYELSCEGAQSRWVTDGWESTEYVHEKEE